MGWRQVVVSSYSRTLPHCGYTYIHENGLLEGQTWARAHHRFRIVRDHYIFAREVLDKWSERWQWIHSEANGQKYENGMAKSSLTFSLTLSLHLWSYFHWRFPPSARHIMTMIPSNELSFCLYRFYSTIYKKRAFLILSYSNPYTYISRYHLCLLIIHLNIWTLTPFSSQELALANWLITFVDLIHI